MRRLCGLDTEYGLLIEGRGVNTQIEDASALVRSYPGECFPFWDYRQESPRTDLRGFTLDRLAEDPVDAEFDQGRANTPAQDLRADRLLSNGARFYNDHGHPEYATPECFSIRELALHDAAGDRVVLSAARAYERETGVQVRIYKNNTDFQGASWGSHENYLAPRSLGFTRLFSDLLPMLLVRQVLCGAGKVGSEAGRSCFYQLSQRADFFVEPANAETLFRRPIFNTRDEPHSDASKWIRLHMICGDSNMISSSTALKAGLVRLAIRLSEQGSAPVWRIAEPVAAFSKISRDESYKFEIELEGSSWTTAAEVFESYFAAAEATLELDEEERWTVDHSRALLESLRRDWDSFRRSVDWAAKRHMLESFMASEGLEWRDPSLRSYDLEYHRLDPGEGLHEALVQMGEVEIGLPEEDVEARLQAPQERTRAWARSLALTRFGNGRGLVTANWRTLTFEGSRCVDLPPEREYPPELAETESVEGFIETLRRIP